MTKLTPGQQALLNAAAEANGAIDPGETAKPTIWSLIKRGLLVADDTGRLSITEVARTALAEHSDSNSSDPCHETEPVQPKAATGKIAALVALLRQEGGTTIAAMMTATGWQAHSVRGAISGAVKKKLGLTVISKKTDAGRVYRITEEAA
jgi:hypothetical protein